MLSVLLNAFIYLFIFLLHLTACRIWVTQPESEPAPLALDHQGSPCVVCFRIASYGKWIQVLLLHCAQERNSPSYLIGVIITLQGFIGGASGNEPSCQCTRYKRLGFNPWVGKMPWKREWQPTPVFLPGESHGRRSLVGYSPLWSQRVRHDWASNTESGDELVPAHHWSVVLCLNNVWSCGQVWVPSLNVLLTLWSWVCISYTGFYLQM